MLFAQFMIKKKILCDHCRGTGAASDGDIHQCGGCGGSGVKLVKQQIFPGMFAQSQTTYVEPLTIEGAALMANLGVTNAAGEGLSSTNIVTTVGERRY